MTGRLARAGLLAALAGAGCEQILSFPNYQPGSGGGGAGGQASSSSSSASSSSTSASSSSTSTSSSSTSTSSSTSSSSTSTSSSSTSSSSTSSGSPCSGDAGPACADVCDADHPCVGTCHWAVSMGTTQNPESAPTVALDPSGDVIIAGLAGNLSFVGGNNNSAGVTWIAKLRQANGTIAWHASIGDGVGGETQPAVAVDASGAVFVAGGTNSAVSLVGGVPVAGAYQGSTDILITKIAANGSVQWSRDFGASGVDAATSVAVASDGSIWVTGAASAGIKLDGATPLAAGVFALHLDPNGGFMAGATFPGLDPAEIAVDAAGNVALTGRQTGTELLSLVRFTDITMPTTRTFGNGQALGKSVSFDAEGNLYLLGETAGAMDFQGACPAFPQPGLVGGVAPGRDVVLARFDPSGACQWAKRFPRLDTDGQVLKNNLRPMRAVADGGGNVVLAALILGAVDFSGTGDAVNVGINLYGHAVVKVRGADGSHLWSRGTSSTSNGSVNLGLDARGGAIVVSGGHNKPMDLGCGPIDTVGALDVDVTRFAL